MKCINTVDAVGHVLCHDITRIVKDVVKDTAFRKGHVVEEKDIPVLLSLGKDHLYVWEKDEDKLHEDEAAQILYEVCKNEHMHPTPVKEGKIELIADCDGLFRVDVARLNAVNEIEDIMIATRHSNTVVKKGERLLGTRVIPLVIAKEKMELVKKTAGEEPLVSLTPFQKMKAGIITTGNEVYHGRIKDTFTPVVVGKLKTYGVEIGDHILCDDNQEKITNAILELKEKGMDMIVCTGGMSVDPDDKTPGAIKNTGAKIISYGAPVLPGAMFLLGYLEDKIPVMGLPGCVMYAKTTVFDLVLPRIIAGIPVTRKELAHLGNGGFCLGCETCHYPNCGFGKGV
ncbi:MAG: molybdopterin-binding protein [Lachnospiraceae bacterium]|jgi:molybdenum cofactor synthesis domain-containing protein|nr:molybdopterin-binding protein [Lachnospiraceae bacterium]